MTHDHEPTAEELARVEVLLAELRDEPAPADVVARLERVLAQQPRIYETRRRRSFLRPRFALAGLGTAAAAILAVTFVTSIDRPAANDSSGGAASSAAAIAADTSASSAAASELGPDVVGVEALTSTETVASSEKSTATSDATESTPAASSSTATEEQPNLVIVRDLESRPQRVRPAP